MIEKETGQCDETGPGTESGYAKDYSETGFWAKVTSYAKSIGREVRIGENQEAVSAGVSMAGFLQYRLK